MKKIELIQILHFDPKELELSIESRQDSLFSHHKVKGFFKERQVSHITIERKLRDIDEQAWSNFHIAKKSSDYYFDLSKDPPVPKPVIFHQWTDRQYRGNGISGHLILAGNDFCKKEFGTSPHSNINFDSQKFKESLIRVWEKLVNEGKAYEYKYHADRRFGMY